MTGAFVVPGVRVVPRRALRGTLRAVPRRPYPGGLGLTDGACDSAERAGSWKETAPIALNVSLDSPQWSDHVSVLAQQTPRLYLS